jgi:uncharacterized protein YegL
MENFDVVFAENPEPRCPVVLLLDNSYSMRDQPIKELNEGLVTFKQSIEEDKLATLRIDLAIITFGPVKMCQDFVSIDQWIPQQYSAEEDTPIGKAINYALDIIENRKRVYKKNGIQYYRPWIFLITDGEPTDDWQPAAQRLKKDFSDKKIQFFAVGVKKADMKILEQITPDPNFPPVALNGLDFNSMFKWLSASLSSVSHSTLGSGQVTLTRPDWGTISTIVGTIVTAGNFVIALSKIIVP